MKVVYVTPTYFSKESVLGGGERFAEELAKAMMPYAQVEVISFGKVNKILPLSDNLKLYIFRNWNKSLLNPFNPFFLKRLIKADIIHCHQYLLFVTKFAIIFAKIFKKKIFITDLGLASRNPTWYFDWSRCIDKFLVISKVSAKFLQMHHAGKEIIYAGVDLQKYKYTAQKERRVLFVGRLLPHKGVEYLIKAVPADIELDIVGQAYDQGYYKLLKEISAGKKVNFFHHLSDSEVAAKFAKALVFVFSGTYENELLGLVFLEAMASGCVTIGTSVGGASEIIVEGETGFIVPPKDTGALKEKIEYLIANPDIAAQMGKAGRRRAEEMFTWDLVAKRCLKAYGACQ